MESSSFISSYTIVILRPRRRRVEQRSCGEASTMTPSKTIADDEPLLWTCDAVVVGSHPSTVRCLKCCQALFYFYRERMAALRAAVQVRSRPSETCLARRGGPRDACLERAAGIHGDTVIATSELSIEVVDRVFRRGSGTGEAASRGPSRYNLSEPRRRSVTSRVVKTIHNPQGNRRVEIFQRNDGSFGFEEWTYAVDEGTWVPFGRYSIAVIDTLERAEQEARGRIAWLAAGAG